MRYKNHFKSYSYNINGLYNIITVVVDFVLIWIYYIQQFYNIIIFARPTQSSQLIFNGVQGSYFR